MKTSYLGSRGDCRDLLFLLCTAMSLYSHTACLGAAYSAEGIITYQEWFFDKVQRETHHIFKITVDPPRWLFRIQAVDTNKDGPWADYVSGYDGAFLYSVGSLTQVPVPNTTFGGAPVTPVVRAHAGIASGLVPPHVPEIGTRLLWLMFVPRGQDSIISQGSGECIWDDPLFSKVPRYTSDPY